MTGRLDPLHDRVELTPEELRSIEQLEYLCAHDGPNAQSAVDADQGEEGDARRSRRSRAVASLRAMGVLGWLVPVGVGLIVVGLLYSARITVFGLVCLAVGSGAWLRRAVKARRRRQ